MPTAWTFMPLSTGGFTLVDAADYERLSKYRWAAGTAGYAERHTTVGGRGGKQRCFYMHREVLGLEHGDEREADHINRDRLDNRRCNLRAGSHKQNTQNQPGHGGTSEHRGVRWHKECRKWHSYSMVDGKQHTHGYFETEQEAADAAASFRAEHMEFAEG